MVVLGLIAGIIIYLVANIYVFEQLEEIAEAWDIDLSILLPTFFFLGIVTAIYLLDYFLG